MDRYIILKLPAHGRNHILVTVTSLTLCTWYRGEILVLTVVW